MSPKGETTEGTTGGAAQSQRTKIIYIVYLIAALDITWMFLQFSVSPVSISAMSEQEADISVTAVNVKHAPKYSNK